jgi:chemotaxis methyl-accepting protein methylase
MMGEENIGSIITVNEETHIKAEKDNAVLSGAGDIPEEREELQRLLEKIYRERGFDFREYKETTLTRRLTRRLRARRCQTYAEYARILDQDLSEYDKLFDDLTINVTSFFRDEVAFKALEETVLSSLIDRQKDRQRSVRIWSAGCATGEEPYSIAMLLLEFLGKDIERWNVAIIATDIDKKALQRAHEGLFAQKEVEGIRQAWRDKYFVPENKAFRVLPVVRQMVSFEVHNLVSDQPYFGMDLVVCRNVLIYFTPELQTRVLKGFHKGLTPEGFLLLGKAEVPVGESNRLFHALDSKAKLYRKMDRGSWFVVRGS